MARRLSQRLRIVLPMTASTAFHVGGAESGPEADLLVAEDGLGEPCVPGTSIAGALRARTERIGGQAYEERVRELWGPPVLRGKESGAASHVIAEDAPIAGATLEPRDGIGIERATGSVAKGIVYNRIVVARGARIDVRLTVELPTASGKAADFSLLIASLLDDLIMHGLTVGAAQTRGLGRFTCQLSGLVIRRERLDRDGVVAAVGVADPYARGKRVTLDELAAPKRRLGVPATATFEIVWTADGPLMAKDGSDGIGVDALPLMTRADGKLAFLLPGSAVKGALRAVAERIVRTVRGDVPAEKKFLDDIDVPLVQELFGSPGRRDSDPRRADGLGRGALSVRDCHSTTTVKPDAWRGIVQGAADAEDVQRRARRAGLGGATAAVHVAVDRWTGGPAAGALYSALETSGVEWEAIRLDLDLARIPDHNRAAAQALLWLVLAELRAGRVGLGYASQRGMGAISVTAVRATSSDGGLLMPVSGGALDPHGDLKPLRTAWQTWQRTPIAEHSEVEP
jgi:CRISPR/Cas system CSM-associated protein Csm3 (group 7 of RAMP superfamily)